MKPTEEDPALLFLYGHGTHKKLGVILYAREDHVHMLSFPSHTTPKLQPSETVQNTLCLQFVDEGKSWYSRINDYDIAKLVSDAYTKVCRLNIAVCGVSSPF